MVTELLPTRSVFAPGEDVVVETRGLTASGVVTVFHLGEVVSTVTVEPMATGEVSLGSLPPGGYGVELESPVGVVRTAVQVLDDPRDRLRYGFVADYRPGRDPAPAVELVRRLHPRRQPSEHGLDRVAFVEDR